MRHGPDAEPYGKQCDGRQRNELEDDERPLRVVREHSDDGEYAAHGSADDGPLRQQCEERGPVRVWPTAEFRGANTDEF